MGSDLQIKQLDIDALVRKKEPFYSLFEPRKGINEKEESEEEEEESESEESESESESEDENADKAFSPMGSLLRTYEEYKVIEEKRKTDLKQWRRDERKNRRLREEVNENE